ncbi:phage tail tape measure protein [Iodobacter sp. LRB]|uniref:phage tail tape measure protein n=1 Tax=unclassified Iodobacter TaxID=235634 RepID=UPI000C11C610|nr:phage tail tape measure protein [Iodobacter sp. BJB302]PHV00162.1 phage tail tape measure protein [Iodobacter sp. BJB302]
MADLSIGIRIGAALAGSFSSAFAGARGTLGQLGNVADQLRARHARLGEAMARAASHPARNVDALRRQYERLGQTLEQLRIRQERLAASMARGAALTAQRSELRGAAMETVGTAVAIGMPVAKSVKVAANFQDQMRDIAITGEFSKQEEAQLSNTVRAAAGQWNQFQDEIGRGMSVLVSGGIQSAKSLDAYAPVMAKAATATRASMDDLGSVALALKNNLKVGEAGFEGALNMLAYAGKRGQFEIRDMAKWLPALAPSFETLGVTGKEAVAEIGASLQIARKGAGTNDEAANNFRNFMQKLTSPDTLKDFQKAHIDLKSSMVRLRAEGMTPLQAMLSMISDYMQTKGPKAAGEFKAAIGLKDDAERKAALDRLSEAYKLGELFQDMQAMAFIRPAVANQSEMKDIKQGSLQAENKDLLGVDYKKRMEIATEQFKSFKIGLTEVGLTIGNVLLPPLLEMLNTIKPSVIAFGEWAKTHPGVIKGVMGLVGGLLAGKLAFIGLKYGINLVLSPFNALGTVWQTLASKWIRLQGLWQMGHFTPLILKVRALGAMLGGQLVSGIMLAGRAVLWLGRALMMNPIGIAITVIGLLIYKYWQPLKAFFIGLWQGLSSVAGPALKALLQGAVSFAKSIGRLVMIIPGVGVAIRMIGIIVKPIFNAIMVGVRAAYTWFKNLIKPIDDVGGKAQNMGQMVGIALGGIIKGLLSLPTQFYKFGGDIVDGLVNGIKSKLGAAERTITEFGQNIKGWFASTLGIQSPSRVFLGFGDNIAQGAALGIGRSAVFATRAVASMAQASATAWGRPELASPFVDVANRVASVVPRASTHEQGANASGGMTISFSPQITIQGGDPAAVQSQVNQAMNVSFAQFEAMMKRYESNRRRGSYGGNA